MNSPLTATCRAPRGARGLKCCLVDCGYEAGLSCPSRGTWIEIDFTPRADSGFIVVPLAGHVD